MNLSFQGLRNQYVPEYFQWISDEHQSDYLTASSNWSIEYMWIRMGNQQSSMIRCYIHQWFLRWYVRHNVYEVSDRKEVRYVSYYSCFLSICIWYSSSWSYCFMIRLRWSYSFIPDPQTGQRGVSSLLSTKNTRFICFKQLTMWYHIHGFLPELGRRVNRSKLKGLRAFFLSARRQYK